MVVFSIPEDASYNGRVVYMFSDRLAKGYIGKSVNFKSRVSKHRTEAYAKKDGEWKCNSEWKKAIRRIGWHNLTVMILEFVGKDESLEERERYWIARLKTDNPKYGYNMNKGGGGPTRHTEEAKAKISAKAAKKPVTSREIKEQFADGTQLVKFVSYASAHEAERQTGVGNGNITNCCNGKRKSAGRRFWHFTKEDDLVGEHRVDNIGVKLRPNARALFSTSPEGKKQRHESGNAAGRTLSKSTGKKFDQGAISACCRGDRKSHHGYTFCFESDEEAENKKNTKKRKRN